MILAVITEIACADSHRHLYVNCTRYIILLQLKRICITISCKVLNTAKSYCCCIFISIPQDVYFDILEY